MSPRPLSAAVVRRLAAGLTLAVGAGAVAAQAVRPNEEIQERAQVRLLTLRLRIRPTWNAEPGACLALGAADLEVVLRGRPVEPERVELDRRRERTLHALLIDTSGSMANSMDQVRSAAAQYVERLDPQRDRALIVTFDDSVLLHQGATADRELLLAAISRIRPADGTSLHDALHYVTQELVTYRERAVIVLLTDGFDTASLHEREDVMERVAAHPDLTIFTIGFDLPELVGAGPSGLGSIRHFLQRLAYRTGGNYIVAPTGSRLDDAYRRIREMLDSEAVLRVEDPDPEADPGKLAVSSGRSGCRVDVLRATEPADDPRLRPLDRPFPELPYDFDVPPDRRYLRTPGYRAFRSADPACELAERTLDAPASAEAEASWRATAEAGQTRGCMLDVTMDLGALYDPYAPASPIGWSDWNAYLETRARPFEIDVPAFADLPDRPDSLVESLAVLVLRASDDEVERDSRRKPADRHARPYHDLPAVAQGRTFFDLRVGLATALFAYPDYRRFALGALRVEAERDLEDLRQRYRRRAPRAEATAIEAALLESEEGRSILARADRPAPADLTRLLAAWLGDVPAHELFVRWESARLDELLTGHRETADPDGFSARWRALREVLYVPSYTRELTILTPAHDRLHDRVGYYRVVLPRVSWMLPRLKDYEKHPGFSDLPLDLLPDLPFAYRAMERILAARPELATHLSRNDYRVRSLGYESLMQPRKRTPRLAFRETRAALVLATGERTATLELDLAYDGVADAEVELIGIRATCEGDPVLAALVAELAGAFDDLLPAIAASRAPGAPRLSYLPRCHSARHAPLCGSPRHSF